MKQEDLCNTCENYWIDLEQAEAHCKVADEKIGFGKMDNVVLYPCLECPFNCYSKKKEL